MEFRTTVTCSKCKQPIVSGEGFGFVCFKIPGKQQVTTFFIENLAAGTAGKLTCRRVSRDDACVHGRTDASLLN